MSAASAGELGTQLCCAVNDGFLPVITPLHWREWVEVLKAADCNEEFCDVLSGLHFSFKLGVHSNVTSTFISKNHSSATLNPAIIVSQIKAEKSAGRYSGPFNPIRLENIIGLFRALPLGTVPKSGSTNKFHIISN